MYAQSERREKNSFFQMILKHKWGILFITFISVILLGSYALRLPNVYESTAFLAISSPNITSREANLTKEAINQRLIKFTQEKVLSDSSLQAVLSKENLFKEEKANGVTTESLAIKIRARALIESESINENSISFRISYRDQSQENAQAVTNAIAEKFVGSQGEIIGKGETIKIINTANSPNRHIAPNRLKFIGLGFVSGIVIGLMFAVLFEFVGFVRTKKLTHASS